MKQINLRNIGISLVGVIFVILGIGGSYISKYYSRPWDLFLMLGVGLMLLGIRMSCMAMPKGIEYIRDKLTIVVPVIMICSSILNILYYFDIVSKVFSDFGYLLTLGVILLSSSISILFTKENNVKNSSDKKISIGKIIFMCISVVIWIISVYIKFLILYV